MKPKIAITHGDINGVGYEVILKTFLDDRMLELCTPIIYGSARIAQFYRKGLEMPQIQMAQIADPTEARDGIVNIINVVGEDTKVEPGHATTVSGAAALAALERAVADIRDGAVDALVTAPINKKAMQSPEFTFPGHTEYLEASAGDGSHALMILFNDRVRVALVTTHLALKDIPAAITADAITEKLRIFSQSLHSDFGIVSPRIAVLSLNPHAGEEGMLGTEETDIIIPAIKEAVEEGIVAFGPYAADGFFGSGNFARFDGVLAMYHDQGLAPFKTMAMESGVNFTAGLPIVRTSPDHGTGYDIAGQGQADESSMRQAIYAAIDIVRNRRSDLRAHRNPLRRQYHDKGGSDATIAMDKD